jgi:hypothetical protein
VNLQQLSDLHEIELLKARYFRLLDTMQWDEFRDVFTDDVQYFRDDDSPVPVSTQPKWVGANSIVENLRRSSPNRFSVHHAHLPEIKFVNDDEATGIWALYEWVEDPVRWDVGLQGYGYFHERYVRCPDGRWRIAEVHQTRLRMNTVPHRPPEPIPEPR